VAYLGLPICCNHCDHAFDARPTDGSGPIDPGPAAPESPPPSERRGDDLEQLRSEHATAVEQLHAARGSIEALRAERDLRDAERSRELEDACAERDRLRDQALELRASLESSRAEVARLEEAVAAAEARHEAACDGLTKQFEVALGRWESERRGHAEEVGRLREDRARAEAELGRVQGDLVAARVRHDEECAALRSELGRLRGEVEDLRRDREEVRRDVEAMGRERDRLEERLGQVVAERGEGERRHLAAVAQRSEALAEAHRLRDEEARRCEDLAGQLRMVRDERDRERQGREAERQDHEQAVAALRREIESERQAAEERVAADREKYLGELGTLREAIEQMRCEAEALHAGREDQGREIDDLKHERDVLAARLAEAEAAGRTLEGRGEPPTSPCACQEQGPTGVDREGERIVERPEGLVAGQGQGIPPGRDLVPALPGPPDLGPLSGDGFGHGTPWPDVVDLAEARQQIGLLSRLLHSAQEANRRLRALYAEQGVADLRRELLDATGRAERLEAEVRAYRGRDEARWHVEVARRAERLDRRRS
jgi:hypothetical protein